jgi:hypothetical protein
VEEKKKFVYKNVILRFNHWVDESRFQKNLKSMIPILLRIVHRDRHHSTTSRTGRSLTMHPFVVTVVIALLGTAPITVNGFVVPVGLTTATPLLSISTSSSSLLDPTAGSFHILDNAQSLWISTIDGDIDKIPVNEFATVFAGGIVRFGILRV